MRRFFCLVALTFFSALIGSPIAAADPVAASVRVDVPMGGGMSGHGSGTVVAVEKGRALILTNKHVCPQAGTINVVWADGTTKAATWLAADATADLAALSVAADSKTTACPPAKAAPPAGTVIVQVGYPHTRGPVRRVGAALARGTWRLMTGASVQHCQVTTEQGDSGSGVFADGKLVGVVWGGDGGTASCVALEDVHRFVSTPAIATLFTTLTVETTCTCIAGGSCTCGPECSCGLAPDQQSPAAKPKAKAAETNGWRPNDPPDGDYGLWVDGTLTYRYFAATREYAPFDGTNYGARFPAFATVAPPSATFQPSTTFGGCSSCQGGNCRAR